jgi:hypothetical protein
MNIFEQATRRKLRFASMRGEVTTELLWDIPLTSKTGFDLDSIAKGVNKELKATAEESFVATEHNPAKVELEIKLDVLKHIIAVKLAEAEDRKKASERAAEKQRLLDILHEKKDEALKDLSVEELQQRLDALNK